MKEKKFFTYKGKPLVRSGETIYYGDLNDKCVVKLECKENEIKDEFKIAKKVEIELLNTDLNQTEKKILKTGEKKGLYSALDIADIWLERALKQ